LNSLYLKKRIYCDILHIVDSDPEVTLNASRICLVRGHNVSLTCTVKYSGTALMPLVMQWATRTEQHTVSNITVVEAISEYQTSLTFMATGLATDGYICTVSFSSPEGIVLPGVASQHSNAPNSSFPSALFAPRRVASKILKSLDRYFY